MTRVLDVIPMTMLASAFAVAVAAQDAAQDWIPSQITLPSDMEIMVDRAVGSTIRLFSFATHEKVEPMMEKWRSDLSEAGYVVEDEHQALDRPELVFSGKGIENAKIVVSPTADDGREVLQFDATLGD